MEDEIRRCVEMLRVGKVILYPTDTIWGIGCDATNATAVSRIYHIKKRQEQKSMLILLDTFEKVPIYVENIPKIARELVASTARPTTFIYPTARQLAHNLIATDGSIAIRIARNGFCQRLIREFGKPIVSTSANVSGAPAPRAFTDISDEICQKVDYIIPASFADAVDAQPSRIIKFEAANDFSILRE